MKADLPTSPGSRFRRRTDRSDERRRGRSHTWSIEAAAVSIHTLRISGKQVTLDLFRQLQDAVLINHDGSLAGPPWGIVNYHQKRCDKLEEHAHVVWQLGDQLRQDTVQPPRWEPYWSARRDALSSRLAPWSVFPAGPLCDAATGPSAAPSVSPELAEASRKSHLDAVPAAARSCAGAAGGTRGARGARSLSVEHSRVWPPRLPRRYGEWIFRLIDINGIECRAKLRNSFLGGPELAAEHSAADLAALLRSSRMRLPPRRSAEPGMRRGGPRSSTCHSCSSPSRTTSCFFGRRLG